MWREEFCFEALETWMNLLEVFIRLISSDTGATKNVILCYHTDFGSVNNLQLECTFTFHKTSIITFSKITKYKSPLNCSLKSILDIDSWSTSIRAQSPSFGHSNHWLAIYIRSPFNFYLWFLKALNVFAPTYFSKLLLSVMQLIIQVS